MKMNRIILLSCMWVTQLCALTIYDLKDTYNILKDEYRHLSPVNGAVWWQTKAIQNMYDFGNYEFKDKVEIPESGDTPPNDLKIFKQTETVRLLNFELFNRVQGSFNITMRGQNIARCFTATTLGKILGFMERFRAVNGGDQASSAAAASSGGPEACAASADSPAEKSKRPPSPGKKSLFAQELKKILNADAQLNELYTQATQGAEFKLTETKDKLISKFANTLADCLSESGYFVFDKEKTKTVPAAPYGFLLGFLYQKAQSRTEIAQFLTAIESMLGASITTHDYKSDAWAADKYTPESIAALKNKNFEDVPLQEILKEYESIAIIILTDVPNLPPPVEYTTVSFEGQQFADCVETTIRNLCNIIFYDKGKFDADKVGSASEVIKSYYQRNNERLTAGTSEAHKEWIPGIENQPWVTYNRLVCADHSLVLVADDQPVENLQGFIHVDGAKSNKELDELFGGAHIESVLLGGQNFAVLKLPTKSFIVVDPTKYKLYELQPTLRNITLVLNKFLGFNLMPDMPKSFIEPTFNQTYFVALAARLAWDFSGAKKEDFDSFDYVRGINVKIVAGKDEVFGLSLSRNHGEILPDIKSKEVIASGVEKKIVSSMNSYSDYIFLPNIVALVCTGNVAKLADAFLFWMGWYVQDLVTIRGKGEMTQKILTHQDLAQFEGLAFKLFATLPQPEDLLPQENALKFIMPLNKFKYLENYFLKLGERDKGFKLRVYSDLGLQGFKGSRLHEALGIASSNMASEDSSIGHALSTLFVRIIYNGKSNPAIIHEVINVANKGLTTPQIGVAMNIFDHLTNDGAVDDLAAKELIIGQAIEATKKGIASGDSSARRRSNQVITKLVRKGAYDIKSALDAAKKGLLDNDGSNAESVMLLFDSILDKEATIDDPVIKDLIIGQTVEATKKGISSNNIDARIVSNKMIAKHIKKDRYDIKEALNTVEGWLAYVPAHPELNHIIIGRIIEGLAGILHELLEKGVAIDDPATKKLIIDGAIKSAYTLLLGKNWHGPLHAVKLFEKLFKIDQGIKEAKDALSQLQQSIGFYNSKPSGDLKKLLEEYEQKAKS